MAVERETAFDFTGGQASRLASTHFSDRQWAKLYGAVIESDSELRSQWPWEPVGADEFVSLGHADDLLVGIRLNGEVATATPPSPEDNNAVASATEWTTLSGLTVPAGYSCVGLVPLPRDAGQGFVTAVLINGTSDAGTAGSAWAVYVNGSGVPAFFEFGNRFPNAASEADGMPRANVATMWGDRLVLGDVEWLEDDDAAFSASNSALYPNGIRLSQPGNPGGWDLLDFAYMGIKDGQGTPRIVDLQPLEQGLLVLTTAGVYLLQGSPSNFAYEEVRPGLGASAASTAGWWPATGSAVWISDVGQVWHSDGLEFLRVDEPLGLIARGSAPGWTAGWDDFVLVRVADRVFAFRLFAQGGAWTELVAPPGTTSVFTLGPCLYALDDSGQPWRLNRAANYRGRIDDVDHEVVVTTRTFEGGDGHRNSFWRYFGVRAQPEGSGGSIERVTIYAGPALSSISPSTNITLGDSALGGRDEVLVPGPGASVEAALEVEFKGDVSVEQVTAFFTNARNAR